MALRSLLAAAAVLSTAQASPLWDYVNAPNPDYKWFNTGHTIGGPGWDGFFLNVTSGAWLNPADSNRYVWTHQVLVVIPTVVKFPDAAALWITGGHNDNPSFPSEFSEDVLICVAMATNTGTVCTVVWQIPNQPVVFPSDPLQEPRSEDAMVGFTWKAYMLNDTATPDWVAYFPMARGAIKAMDAATEFAASINPLLRLKRWITMGGSKRGWATWFTGAVDPRIIGIVPCVMDLLNFQEGVQGMWRTLGNWTFAFKDYLALDIPAYFGTPTVDRLAAVIDPIVYKENLTMSKLVVDATGDEFFQLQDDQYWWGQLPGETHRMIVDNAEHSLITGALYIITSVQAWWWGLLTNSPRPQFNWTIDHTTGDITVNTFGAQKPSRVVMRYTTTLDETMPRRDFRLVTGDTAANPCAWIKVDLFGPSCLRPIIWLGEDVGETAPDTYVLRQPAPPAGKWRAMLAELYYDGPAGSTTQYQLTTQASIFPFTYPYPPCYGEGCMGGLV